MHPQNMHQPVSSLELPDSKVQELQSLGYHYCKDVNEDSDEFKTKVNIPNWGELTHIPKTKNALDIYQEECVSGSILTFNKQLDAALGGGIPMGLITEFCGEPGCGKTQICFHLCVNVQLPVWFGGMAGEAVYISTNKGFASHRLREIATTIVNRYTSVRAAHDSEADVNNSEFNVESIMKNISYVSASDHVELIAAVRYLQTWLESHSRIRLVVIDSISAPLKSLDGQERTQVIYSLLSNLQKLAQKHKFAIIVTNDMTTRIKSAGASYHTPSLGGSYYHRLNIRIQLSKLSANVFKACVVKSIFQPPSEIEFSLF